MSPVISRLSTSEEAAVLSSLLKHHPSLRVDMLEASAAVKEGENFMSVVTRVDVAGHDMNGKNVDMCLIMKSLPESEERRQMFQCDDASSNEAAFYSRVLPTMLRQSSVKLAFPPCLHATDNLIILEHLGLDGYVMADRRQGLDLQHCQLVMKELGKFHAVSYALKYNKPEEFAKISSSVKEIFVRKENLLLNAIVDNTIDMALAVATDIDSPVVKRLESIRGNGYNVLLPQVTPSEPKAVLCHGDLWSNNLLFRYSSDDTQTPSDVCFLDLQGCRYASPSLDILYFLFSSSRPGVVRQYFHQLIAFYHHALVDHLQLLAPLAPSVSLDDVMADLKHHGIFGLVMSLVVLPVVTAGDMVVSIDDVTEESLLNQTIEEVAENGLITAEYKKRVNENLDLFFVEGLIKF